MFSPEKKAATIVFSQVCVCSVKLNRTMTYYLAAYGARPVIISVFGRRCRKTYTRGRKDTRSDTESLSFLKVFWIRTNTVNVKDKNSIIWMNYRVLMNIRANYCAFRWVSWTENNFRVRVHAIRSKQVHIVCLLCVSLNAILFNNQGLWIVFQYC